MAKILLIGPAGSGKTHQLLDDFEASLKSSKNPLQEDFYFLVPSAEHTDRVISLIVQRAIPGFFHQRVTTFSSLISKVFHVGDDLVASNVTRFLILRDLFERETFEAFREVQNAPGFLRHILQFLMELKESQISTTLFRERTLALKKLEPDLAPKYEALSKIYESYQQALEARGLHDRQDFFSLYQEKKARGGLKEHRFKKLWLDGFFDFSELQFLYLKELCELSDDVVLTLTYDSSKQRTELFQAVLPVLEILKKIGFEVQECKSLSERRPERAPALNHIEKNLFAASKPKSLPKSSTEVTVFEAIGMEGEIEMIARTIRHMYRKGDLKLSDFSILLRQIGDYESVIRSVFRRYDIPVEIHERERLGFSPLIQTLAQLFRVLREDWKLADLIDFLKSSYVRQMGNKAKSYEWVSELELRAKRQGVFRGRAAWLEAWAADKKSSEEKEFDQSKQEFLEPLAMLEDQLKAVTTFKDLRRILSQALKKDFGIFHKSDSKTPFRRRDAVSMRRFESILGEIEASMTRGKEAQPISFESFSDHFFRLIELDLYSLRERDKNQVQVYDVSLARQKEYQVVFVAGLLEKKFPVQIHENPIFSDWERRLFNANHEEGYLKEKLPRQMMERYLFYLAVTRARDRLFLTYPRLDLEGKESLPSYYVSEVRSLFTGPLAQREQQLTAPYPSMAEVVSERELEVSVMGELWRPLRESNQVPASLLYLTNELLKRPESQNRFRRAFYQVEDALTDPMIAKTELFAPSKTSATRLEEYGKCAFRYYAHRILKLQDPEEDVNVMTRGTILHDVLENCFKNWVKTPEVLGDLKKAKKEARQLLETSLKKYPLILEKRYQLELEKESLIFMIESFLETELERLKTASFQPRHFEFDFGGENGDAPALEIETEDGVILVQGKIDRVDIDSKGKLAMVVDYKRTASFKKADLEIGTALQLPLYALAVQKYLDLKPVGGELYSIKSRKPSGFYRKEYANLFPSSYTRRLMLEEGAFAELLARGVRYVKKFSADMASLKMEAKPRSCESFCPYPSVCRIEKWKLPMILEEIKKEDEKESESKVSESREKVKL